MEWSLSDAMVDEEDDGGRKEQFGSAWYVYL